MRPISLDTNAYVNFKRGSAPCVEIINRTERLLISSTVIGELLAGFACGSQEARNRQELSQFLASPRVGQCPSSLATADTYALVYRDLRSKGRPIPTNDIWIAASAMEMGSILCSFDEHFQQVDGLRIIRSWAEALP
ncbi:type II toxin-antitoxin system VapC family toxin [Cyanobium sp. HWJ4-Hawea]|uniref:type II toxin-antitoxin system VapC family toxin n=1 Tax=Cyanobium sp. HWJ4-Hawea TaxID=2823713 RepID=UPI0020CEF061|nr:type II toxin-antitoxin system VapC family toxin [Cyanobium sp. HWJ4-Hawea]MCP9809050.1 type II toxin-antitoxin system VapC family toxin [Cyanobium sp. HWJ4-Hawea]